MRDQVKSGVVLRATRRSCAAARAEPYLCPAFTSDTIPFGALMNKGLTVKTGQTHVPRYHAQLLKRLETGEIDPSFVITHRVSLENGPAAYKTFPDKQDDCIEVVLKPWI